MTSVDISKLPFQSQLAETEWWSGEKLLSHQFQQIAILVEHARKTIPYYRNALEEAGLASDQPIDEKAWRRLRPLTRRDVQRLGDSLHSTDVPDAHGEFLTTTTSGSTGTPVTVRGTELDAYYTKAFQLRLHLWCGVNFSKKMANIHKLRGGRPGQSAIVHSRWGDEATYPFPTGPSVSLDVEASVDQQIQWLEKHRPAYLSVYPSILHAILNDYAAENRGPPGVEMVLTLGEVLEPEVREQCRRVWGVPIYDNYSSMEVGPIAFLRRARHGNAYLDCTNGCTRRRRLFRRCARWFMPKTSALRRIAAPIAKDITRSGAMSGWRGSKAIASEPIVIFWNGC